MPTKLSQMIAAQPQALREVAQLDISAEAERLRACRRLFLVGTGTSHHAALLGAQLLRAGGLDAHAVPSSEFVRWRPAPADGDGLIVITHTGETAYAQAARAAALAAGTPLVSITGPQVAWPEATRTPLREEAETYTVSYTTALATLGLLAHALSGIASGPEQLLAVADEVAAVLAEPGLAEVGPPARTVVLVGPGPWAVSAREGALKLREAAHILAEGFDSEFLLHGAAVPYRPGDVLIGLAPEADRDGLSAGVIAAAAAEGVITHTFSGAPSDGSPAAAVLAQFPVTARLQLLTDKLAAFNRTDPDTVITGAWAAAALWAAGAPAY